MTDLKDNIISSIKDISLDGTLLIDVENCFKIGINSQGEVSDNIDNCDCTLKLGESTLRDLLSGELDPMSAYFSGDLSIDGDMSIAMSLAESLKK